MSMTDMEKKKRFQEIARKTDEGIRKDHTQLPYKVKGWFRNKWRRLTYSPSSFMAGTAKTAATVGGAITGKVVSNVPFIGLIFSTAAKEAINVANKTWIEYKAQLGNDLAADDETLHYKGEWNAIKGAEALADAVRKVDDAATKFQNCSPYQNCDEFMKKVSAFYYYKYRVRRLHYYMTIMDTYNSMVKKMFDREFKRVALLEADFENEGWHIFDKWEWHSRRCSAECCVFPWETLEISQPTITSRRTVFSPLASNADAVIQKADMELKRGQTPTICTRMGISIQDYLNWRDNLLKQRSKHG